MDDQRLGQLTLDIFLNAKEKSLNLRNHLIDLILTTTVGQHGYSEGVLYPLDLPYTYDHVFLGRRFAHDAASLARIRAKCRSLLLFTVLVQFLFDLLKPGHHLSVLHLHLLQLCLQVLILLHLGRVLSIDTGEVLHDLRVLVLHLSHLVSPLLALLIFLLLQNLTLLFNPLLFELQHLYLIVYVLALHLAQLDLVFNH